MVGQSSKFRSSSATQDLDDNCEQVFYSTSNANDIELLTENAAKLLSDLTTEEQQEHVVLIAPKLQIALGSDLYYLIQVNPI